MRCGKGFSGCGRDHPVRQRHSRDEITAFIERLNCKHLIAFLTVEKFSLLNCMTYFDDDVEAEMTMEWAQCTDNDSTEGDGTAIVLYEKGEITEHQFYLAVFPHVSDVCYTEEGRDRFKVHDREDLLRVLWEYYIPLRGLGWLLARISPGFLPLESAVHIVNHSTYSIREILKSIKELQESVGQGKDVDPLVIRGPLKI